MSILDAYLYRNLNKQSEPNIQSSELDKISSLNDPAEVDRILMNLGVGNMSKGQATQSAPITMNATAQPETTKVVPTSVSKPSVSKPQESSSKISATPIEPEKEDTTDQDSLDQARKTSALLDFMGSTRRAFEKISAGLTNVKPDLTAGQEAYKAGEDIIAQAKEDIQLRQKQAKDAEERALKDPNSSIAKFYKHMLQKDYNKYLSPEVTQSLPNLNAVQAKEILDQARERFKIEQEVEAKRLSREEMALKREEYKTASEANRALRQRALDEQDKEREKLPAAQQKQLTELEFTLGDLENIKNQFTPDLVGSIKGPATSLKRSIGIIGPKEAAFRDSVEQLLQSYLKATSGTAVSEPEYIRVKNSLPNMIENPKAFKASLDNFENAIKRRQKAVVDVHKKVRSQVNPESKPLPEISSNISDWKPVTLKDGRKGYFNSKTNQFTQDINEAK